MKRKKNSPIHKKMFFARMNGSRGKEVLDAQLKDYKGLYIQHDGYGAYINVGERLKGQSSTYMPGSHEEKVRRQHQQS